VEKIVAEKNKVLKENMKEWKKKIGAY